MRVVIVDDDELFVKTVEGFVLQENWKNRYGLQVITYCNGWDLVDSLDETMADVYLLDIEIGDVDGLELARRIREVDEHAYLIFLTSHEKYAIRGYEYQAYGYIVKDQWRQHLAEIIERIWESEQKRQDDVYLIQTGYRYDKLYMEDIMYIEKASKYAVFYCRNGRIFHERLAMGELYKKLPHREFIFVNRSQIVNVRYITHIETETVELDDRIHLPVSRNMLRDMRKHLLEYWRKE